MMEQRENYRYIDDVTGSWGTNGKTLSEPSTDKQGMKPYSSDIGTSVNGVCGHVRHKDSPHGEFSQGSDTRQGQYELKTMLLKLSRPRFYSN